MAELDTFKIRAPLRCEGIGRLDCAEDATSGERLAVRWLPLEANGKAAAQACEQLPSHPGLPRIHRTGEVGSSAFVAVDFPEGRLLATMLGDPLSPSTIITVVAQLADALAAIHAQGLVHGELSADSVLLVLPEKAFLWDVPLVVANRVTDRRGEERVMQQLVKTGPFLAPERARGEKPTTRSDVYALGAIAAIAAGAELPPAETTLALVHTIAMGEWQPQIPKHVPEPMRSMLERMVSELPEDRPTAREVADLFVPPTLKVPTQPEMAAVVLPSELVMPDSAMPGAFEMPSPGVATMPQVLGQPAAGATAITMEEVEASAEPQLAADADVSEVAKVEEEHLTDPAVLAVPLADNVHVDIELAAAGAVSYSAEEVRAQQRARARATSAVAGLALLVTIGVGMAARRLFTSSDEAKPSAPIAQLAVPAPTAAPSAAPAVVVAPKPDDELLSPLAPKAQAKPQPKRTEAPAASAEDFGFLEHAPSDDLKRPAFEPN